MSSLIRRLLTLAASIGLVMLSACASDQVSGGLYDVVFYATGTVSEVDIDGGAKTVSIVIETCNYEEPEVGECALFDFSDFDDSWRVPRDDLNGIQPGDKVKVSFFLGEASSGGYPGEKITKLTEQLSTRR